MNRWLLSSSDGFRAATPAGRRSRFSMSVWRIDGNVLAAGDGAVSIRDVRDQTQHGDSERRFDFIDTAEAIVIPIAHARRATTERQPAKQRQCERSPGVGTNGRVADGRG